MNSANALPSLRLDDSTIHLANPPTLPGGSHPAPVLPLRPPPRWRVEPGRRLGQYRLIRELGSGSMGIVFEAEDEWLRRRVALKLLRADLPAEQAARERFLREARAMAAVEHDHVVAVFNVGEVAGRPYMAMPLLAGETLDARLAREPRLPPAEAARIGREIALGLAAAHAKGLVHRDVKPGNIWLEAGTGRVKLLDFGLAVSRDTSQVSSSGYVIGTPAFMSPEQARADPLDGRSDLFSLGAVLYLALTGDRPFDGPDLVALVRNLELHYPTRVNVKRPDVPAALSNLVMELLAKDRKDRPESAGAVAARLARPEVSRPSHLPAAPPAVAVAPPPAHADALWPPDRPSSTGSLTRFVALFAATVFAIAAYGYYRSTDYGRLAVEADLPDAEVQVRQNGLVRQTISTDRPHDLRPGAYELVLVRPTGGYRLTRPGVEIRRGHEESVRVVRDPSLK